MKALGLKREEAQERQGEALRLPIVACQYCSYHKNNPSSCSAWGYVGRKAEACADFKRA